MTKILCIPDLPEYHIEYLEKMKKDKIEFEKSSSFNTKSVAAFFASYSGNTTFEWEYNGPCHAGLNNFPKGSIGVVSYVMRNFKLGKIPKGFETKIYDYLINRSPFSQVFVDYDGGAFYCRTDIPSNYLASALVATRVAWEFPTIVTNFETFVDNGMSEDVAFVMAHNFRDGIDKFAAYWGHICFYPSSVETIKNFVNREFVITNKNYIDYTRYSGLDALWCGNKRVDNLQDNLVRWLKEFNEKPKEVISYNPWQKTLDNFLNKKAYVKGAELYLSEKNMKEFVAICNREFAPDA